MPINREALKKSLYDAAPEDEHAQLLIKGMIAQMEWSEGLPCEEHKKSITDLYDKMGSVNKTIWKWMGAIGATIVIAGFIIALIQIFWG